MPKQFRSQDSGFAHNFKLTPSFHVYYLKQLNQLSRFIKIDTWRRLTSQKHPLSLEQASSIHPEVEDLLNKAFKNYSVLRKKLRLIKAQIFKQL